MLIFHDFFGTVETTSMSTLYVVSTPIGNLSDITFRAIEILRLADEIVCEDTRHTKKLLDHYQIAKPLMSFHEHSGAEKLEYLIEKLKNGQKLAFVTDAGTPCISDPGAKLVARAVHEGISIVPIPGVSAVVSALSVSGFPADTFTFHGFMPHKKGKETLMKKIAESEITSVFYESTHRIIKTLEMLARHLDKERKMVVCRELTKKFETIYRGTLDKILEQLRASSTKGEFTVVVAPK